MMASSRLRPVDYIAKRFRDHLPGIPFFLVMELDRSGTCHVHGAVAAPGVDLHLVRTGLRKIAGDRRKLAGSNEKFFHDHIAVDIRPADQSLNFGGRNGIFGWATYCAKRVKRTRLNLGASPIARSLEVSKRARAIHADIVGAAARCQTDVPFYSDAAGGEVLENGDEVEEDAACLPIAT